MQRLTVHLENGLYMQNPEKVDGKIVGDQRCIQRLAQYERVLWHLKKCDEYARKVDAIERIINKQM